MSFCESIKIDEAERYILERADQLNGDLYSSLLPIAGSMESEGRNLAATIIYRSLLNSILERGHAKAYQHGIDYLETLDKLAAQTGLWENFDDHAAFKARIYQAHGRKRSFWSNYEMKK